MKDGVYIGLPESEYFAVDSIGSSDIAVLHADAPGWWWQSRHNPAAAQRSTNAQDFGTAIHCMLLEGNDAFEKRYAIEPDPAAYPEALRTIDNMRDALAKAGVPIPAKKATKADYAEAVRAWLPDAVIWDDVMKAAIDRARKQGRSVMLNPKEAEEINFLRSIVLDHADATVATGGIGGVRLSEISVFATEYVNGKAVRVRFRFDNLLPTATVDLKTIALVGTNLRTEVRRRILRDGARLQAGWARRMRRIMNELIGDGEIFGGTDQQRAVLKRFWRSAPADKAEWIWVFVGRYAGSGAPGVQCVRMRPDDPMLLQAEADANAALESFVTYRERFGLDRPWYLSGETMTAEQVMERA